ncbi:MAG: FAD:protein FMN transferase [Akkermansia sp.]
MGIYSHASFLCYPMLAVPRLINYLRFCCYSVVLLLTASGGLYASTEPLVAPQSQSLWKIQQPLMGTLFTIKVYTDSHQRAQRACEQAFAIAQELQDTLSAKDACSELTKLNAASSLAPYSISETMAHALSIALFYAKASHGAFDPTLGTCLRLWHQSHTRHTLPSAQDLARARASSGWQHLSISGSGSGSHKTATKAIEGLRIDLGGIGKGIAVDAMAHCLQEAGLTRFCISSTSDVLVGDPPPNKTAWEVALGSSSSPAITFHLVNEAISTSGDQHQFIIINGTRYSHIIDPKTGMGLTSQRQVTVRAKTATEADALSTACCVLSDEESQLLLRQCPNAKLIYDTNDHKKGREATISSSDPKRRAHSRVI